MLSSTCPMFFLMESIVSYFSGMRVLITGAGSGIGALMAEKLAKQGAEVLVSARRMEAANQVVERIHTDGGRAFPVLLDVSDTDSILAARDQTHRDHGRIDMLVNNAGVVFGGTFEEVSLDDHLNTFR